MTFCNEVNRKYPPEMTSNNSRAGRINATNNRSERSNNRGRGRGNARNSWSGDNRGQSRGRGRGTSRGHPNTRRVMGANGRELEIHASYNFPTEVWNAIPPAEKRKIHEERQQFKNNKRMKVSETSYVPPAINVHQEDARSLAESTTGAVSISQTRADQSVHNSNEYTNIVRRVGDQSGLFVGRHNVSLLVIRRVQ